VIKRRPHARTGDLRRLPSDRKRDFGSTSQTWCRRPWLQQSTKRLTRSKPKIVKTVTEDRKREKLSQLERRRRDEL